jgi:hypothetical protein
MKCTYNGPFGSGIDVIHADPDSPATNTVTHCPPGEPVELPDVVALEQMAAGTLEPGDKAAEGALKHHRREASKTAEPVAETTAPTEENT